MTVVRNPKTGSWARNSRRRPHGDLTSYTHVIHALERARRADLTGQVPPTVGLGVALCEFTAVIWLIDTFAGDDLHPLIVAAVATGVIILMAFSMLAPETLLAVHRQRQHDENPVGRLLSIIGGPAALPAGWFGQISGGNRTWRPGFERIERWVHRELPSDEEREIFDALADEYDGTLAELVVTTRMLIGRNAAH